MKTTKIEWTDRTWNPVTGCQRYQPAYRIAANETAKTTAMSMLDATTG